MTAAVLPPIPRPPHDPTSLLCDARVGWPRVEIEHAQVTSGALTLARSPDSLRRFTEPSGSFGGLRPPANVASCGDAIWLLDRDRGVLRRFDPCSCAFEDVPCGGTTEGPMAEGPNVFRAPVGLAAFRNRLFVGDAGNSRVAVFVQPTLALAAEWRPDPSVAWQPSGVAIDGRGIVYVADPMNGSIHRFSPFGWYLGRWDGFGASTYVAVDRLGTVYAAGAVDAYRVDADGRPVLLTGSADDVTAEFTPLPFAVDGDGRLLLGGLCTPPSDAIFDLHGNVTTMSNTAVVDRWMRAGTVVLGPFDSLIDECLWHRVILRGDLPNGCSTAVDTLTSDVELPPSELAQLPAFAWETRLVCNALDGHDPAGGPQWDGLITSQPGRYLWLRLGLAGNGRTTPRLDNVEIEFPRVSLRRYMPAVYGAEPRSADFTDRLLALFDRELRDTEHTIDTLASFFDPLSTPDLRWLASWIGMTLDPQLSEDRQRTLLARWSEAAALRGTRYGLWQVLIAYLGLDSLTTHCQCSTTPCSCRRPQPTCPPTPPFTWKWEPPPLILEHYKLRRWLELGTGRLGDQAVLWGKRIVNRSRLDDGAQVGVTQLKATQDPLRDPFHVYAHRFTVFVPAAAGATPGRRRALERLIRDESPAHTEAQVEYVEPRFRIGFQSMIGLDSVVAQLPEGVTLGETPIGPGSVLTGSDDAFVDVSRIGTTAVLE